MPLAPLQLLYLQSATCPAACPALGGSLVKSLPSAATETSALKKMVNFTQTLA